MIQIATSQRNTVPLQSSTEHEVPSRMPSEANSWTARRWTGVSGCGAGVSCAATEPAISIAAKVTVSTFQGIRNAGPPNRILFSTG